MSNDVNVLIESFEHYSYFIKNIKDINHQYSYFVSNYDLEELLLEKNEKTINILNIECNKKLNDDLCKKLHEIIGNICGKKSPLLNYFNDDHDYFEAIERSLKTYFLAIAYKYKCFLSVCEIIKRNNSKLIVLGDSKLSNENHLSLDLNRYENLFINFANYYDEENIELYDLANVQYKFDYYNNNKDKINKRKFIDISTYWFYNNFSSIFFKLHKKLKINFLNLILLIVRRKKKKIIIWNKYNYNDLIMSAYYDLVKNSSKIKFYHHNWDNYTFNNLQYEKFKENYFEKTFKLLESLNLKNLKNYFSTKEINIFTSIISENIIKKYFRYKSNKLNLQKQFESIHRNFLDYHCIFTNGFYRIEEKLMFRYIEKKYLNKKYNFIAFEHGLSYGVERMLRSFGTTYSMKYADIGVYMTAQSYQFAKDFKINKKILFSGFPKFYKNSFINYFPAFLLKLLLGLNISQKYILLPLASQNNNYVYGPYYITDYQKEHCIHQIIQDLLITYPNHNILLKKYPGQRYIDVSTYKRFKNKYKNVYLIDDIEMKTMKKIPDVNVSFYFSSTLGVLSSASQDLLIYEFHDGTKIDNISKKGINKKETFNKFFINKNDLYKNWDNSFINDII